MKTVFVNGCFDVLHVGHLELLQFARAQGDRLIVGINSDASIKRLKGANRPINGYIDRIALLSALSVVDLVFTFYGDDVVEVLNRFPGIDVWVKGKGYNPTTTDPKELAIANQRGIEVVYMDDHKKPINASSSTIIERFN